MSGSRWVVRCDDHTTDPRGTEQSARRLLEQIEEFGACRLPHEVVEVPSD